MRFENIDLQTHHKRTARLLLSLCALDVYLQYVCRVDGSRRKLLATEKSVTMFDRMDGSKPARGTSPQNWGHPAALSTNPKSVSLESLVTVFPVAKWKFQNAESVRVESVNRHRAYFPLVRLFQTLKNAAKV